MNNIVEKVLEDEVGIITLNDSKHLNALSTAVLDGIREALDDFRDKVRVVIIRAPKGVKVFSAGFNIKELPKHARDPLTYWHPLRKTIRAIQQFPHPVISMVEGSVWGGCFELVMACDILICDEKSTFAITPAKLGIPYDISGVQNLTKNISISSISEMLFVAKPICAERARMLGVVNHILSNDKLEEFTMGMANDIKQNSPLAISILKQEVRMLTSSCGISPDDYEKIQAGRRKIYDSNDYAEGINSFFEKRKPVFSGK